METRIATQKLSNLIDLSVGKFKDCLRKWHEVRLLQRTSLEYMDAKNRLKLARKLYKQCLVWKSEQIINPPNQTPRFVCDLFLAHSYNDENMRERVRALVRTVAEKHSINVLAGDAELNSEKDPADSNEDLAVTVRSRIEQCDLVLVIATSSHAWGNMASPWIFFEIGIAWASRKPVQLLASSRVKNSLLSVLSKAENIPIPDHFDDLTRSAMETAVEQAMRELASKLLCSLDAHLGV